MSGSPRRGAREATAGTRSWRPALALAVALGLSTVACADAWSPLEARRILFLGDSITYAGGYVAWLEAQARMRGVDPLPEFINLGLPSETCSGLSEPGHPFPRPDVHERLTRALARVQPDVVVAAYGMNDGIYHPFSDARFAAFQAGINRLIDTIHRTGATLVLMTPPPFDAVALRDSGTLAPSGADAYAYFAIHEDYDQVLARYSEWIVQQADRVEMVIDLRTPFVEHLARQRQRDPGFTLSPDGIHPDADGHRLLGRIIARVWGLESREPHEELLGLVQQKMTLLRDAWLTDIGHGRPGVTPGLPVADAMARAGQIEARIEGLR